MKILLVGNYPYLNSQSMDRFAAILQTGMKKMGNPVQLVKPKPLLGRLTPFPTGIGKWLGYLDRFLVFLPNLDRAVNWADIVHICDQANAVYAPRLRNKPHVITCHDMTAIRSALGEIKEHATRPTGKVYQRWILSGMKQSQHIVCVSHATRDDVKRLTGIDDSRLTTVRNCLNFPYRRMSAAESLPHLRQIGLDHGLPFFLHVGGNYWYKNRSGLLRIFTHLHEPGRPPKSRLVLAGEKMDAPLRNLARSLGIADMIAEAPNVTNEQLCALYSSAEGLIFPSLYEGFGWPIIEAQACGCPVFTSNRLPMTETGGNGAVYFDPLDETGAATAIASVGTGKKPLRERGFTNLRRFAHRSMIDGYLECYRRALSN